MGHDASLPLGKSCRCCWTIFLLLAVVVTGLLPVSAHAKTEKAVLRLTFDALVQNWSKLPEEAQLDAIEQFIKRGRSELAFQFLKQTEFHGHGSKLRAKYLHGEILKANGRYEEAAEIFRGLLASHPQFQRVRMELAHTLYLMEEDQAARHHFELVLGGSGSDPIAVKTIQGYLHAIDDRRRWNFSSYITLAPSTNFNQGSSVRTVLINGLPFLLDEGSVKKSGIGLVGGFQGSYRHPITDRIDIVASAGGYSRRYREAAFNDMLANVTLGPRYRFDDATLGLYAIANKRWYADEDYSLGFGWLLSGSMRFGPQDIAFADLQCAKQRYDSDWNDSDLSYQDGYKCSLDGNFNHYINSTTFVRVLAGLGREKTGADHLDSKRWQAGAGVFHDFPMGFSLYLQGLYTKRHYDGLFPFLTEGRKDKRFDISAQLTKRDWIFFGFAPMLQYTYTRNFSNVEFYNFDAHGANLTLTKKF